MKKKLTHGGGAPMVLSLVALIVALAASFQEYLARWIYNLAFDGETDKVFVSDVIGYFTMERDSVSVISLYTEKAFILAIVAFAAFVTFAAACSKRKKKIVAAQAWTLILTSAACCIEPVIYMIYFFSNNLQENFSAESDGVRFRSFYGFLIYALPLLVALLLIIAALIILARLAKETAVSTDTAQCGGAPAADGFGGYQTQPAAPVIANTDSRFAKAEQMPEAVIPPVQQTAPVSDAVWTPPAENADVEAFAPAADTAQTETTADTAPAADAAAGDAVEAVVPEAGKAVFCHNCGKQLDPSAKFCNVCGTKR